MNNTITIVKENKKVNEEVILSANESYSCMNICKYVMPVPETPTLQYHVVKEQPKEDKFITLDYAL